MWVLNSNFMSTFKNELNPKLWNKEELKPEVAKKLKEIATAFIDFLEIPKDAVKDIVITGSQASYNYTAHSDIDLHIIVDPEKVHENCPIVGEYLLSKKSEFNQKHDIFIYNIPVEVYTELEGQGTIHNGLYSLNAGWIDYPEKIKPLDNDMAVKAKYEEFVEAAKEIKEGDLAEKLLDKIKKMRKAGLEKGGEFSVENLVFKKLRNNGIIGKLMNIRKEKIDKKLSLEEALEVIEYILEKWNNNSAIRSNGDGTEYQDDSEDKYHAKKYGIEYHDREMSPDQYIQRATHLNNKAQGMKLKPKTVEKRKRESLNSYSIENLKDKITDPNKEIDRPYLDYATGGQEGLHRAIAAKDAGLKKIPVRVFHSKEKGGNYIKKKMDEALDILEEIIGEKWSNNSGRAISGKYAEDSETGDKIYAKKYDMGYHDREMSPQEYIKRANRIANKTENTKISAKDREDYKREHLYNDSIEDLKKKITSKSDTIDRPYLDYAGGEQQGFHRAIAAKDAGIEKIPVRVFHDTKKNGNIWFRKDKNKVQEALDLIDKIAEGLNEMMGGEGGICTGTSVMAPYPVDVIGRPAPFRKSKKKSHGEKRAPHTEIHEEYEKQNNHREKPAMYKYGYKKNGPLGKAMNEIAETCEAIIAEAEGTKERLQNKFLPTIKDKLAEVKAGRRRAQKVEGEARKQLKEVEKDKESKAYPIKSMMLKDMLNQEREKKEAAMAQTKELAAKRDKIS